MNARIQHVSLPRPAGTEVETRAFYGTLLGLVEIAPPLALHALDLIWYSLGETELHLFAEVSTGKDNSGRHVCMAVDDVEDLRVRLEEAGMAVVGTIPIPGRPRYFVRDPFGNLLEITTIEADYRQMEA